MIQRIQSVWLLLTTIALMSLFFIPTIAQTDGADVYEMIGGTIYKTTNGATTELSNSMGLVILIGFTGFAAFANIFNFRNRTFQKRVAFLLILLVVGISFWTSRFANDLPGGLENVDYKAGFFMPIVAIACCVLTTRGISADEKLLRSADRLR